MATAGPTTAAVTAAATIATTPSIAIAATATAIPIVETKGIMDEKQYLTGRTWCFDAHYWNGTAWASSKGMMINRRLEKKTISVLSYNIWFGAFQQAERMRQLGIIMASHDPDIICLQEVTPVIMSLLLSQEWTHQYFVTDPEGKQLNGYGVAIFSKVCPHQVGLRDLGGRMGRKALIATYLQKDGTQLTVGTFHLESYPHDRPVRVEQMELYVKLLEGLPGPIVLCGDTNFSDGDIENEQFNAAGLTDAWIALKQSDAASRAANPGYTFDTSTNIMTSTSASAVIVKRIDRLFYTPTRVQALDMHIIGTKPYAAAAWPSDHYGIVTSLKLA